MAVSHLVFVVKILRPLTNAIPCKNVVMIGFVFLKFAPRSFQRTVIHFLEISSKLSIVLAVGSTHNIYNFIRQMAAI